VDICRSPGLWIFYSSRWPGCG